MTNLTSRQENTATHSPRPTLEGQNRQLGPDRSQKRRLGWIVAGSLTVGVLTALLLVAAPVIPATEAGVTGAILLGLALGWTMLAGLSVRFTNRPQKWALAPALLMGLASFLLLAIGSPAEQVIAWVGPPVLLVLAVWMIVQAHRHLRSRGGRALLYPVIALLALASVSSAHETVREMVDAEAAPTEGRMVDVGGHRLYLNCTGSGSPTVVLEPGAGMMSSDLAFIAPVIARDTRVCVYDRAGRGWSEPAKTPQDGAQIATDLHTLLQRANEPGPYVLAGHSFGGLYALTFAARFPEDVAGLVLVDSTAPAARPESTPPATTDSDDTMNRVSALGAIAAQLGLGRLVGVEKPSHFRSTIDEYLHAGPSAQHAAALRTFTDKPLVVLTAGVGNQPGWVASQDSLASLSTNTVHRVISGATHPSLISDKDDAAETARWILEAVTAVRTGSPLLP